MLKIVVHIPTDMLNLVQSQAYAPSFFWYRLRAVKKSEDADELSAAYVASCY
jgi:hypothetical protein